MNPSQNIAASRIQPMCTGDLVGIDPYTRASMVRTPNHGQAAVFLSNCSCKRRPVNLRVRILLQWTPVTVNGVVIYQLKKKTKKHDRKRQARTYIIWQKHLIWSSDKTDSSKRSISFTGIPNSRSLCIGSP